MINKEIFAGVYQFGLDIMPSQDLGLLRVSKVHCSVVQLNRETAVFGSDIIFHITSSVSIYVAHSNHTSALDECLPKHVFNFPIRISIVVRYARNGLYIVHKFEYLIN